jgi:succinate dehydrogenase/fumarate reductase cytochrome b subunit
MLDFFSTKIAYASSLDGFIGNVDTLIINPLIYLLFALAVVFFLYGVLEFFMNQENEEKKTTGKSHMLWGIVGITIMLGVWTILGVILNTLGLSGQIQINQNSSTVNLNQ